MADLFAKADILLFKERQYLEAESIYRQIVNIEKTNNALDRSERNWIDALNSIGYCIKFRTSLQDLLDDSKKPSVFS